MTKVLFKRKTSDEIATLPVEDGALIYNYETGATYLDYDDERIPTGGGMPTGDTFPIGAITSYAGSIAPTNWLICDGSAISRTTYADLFGVIGTSFGSGNGSTTFNLPDLRSRVPLGKDSRDADFDTIGETYGEKNHTLTVNEMPSHAHSVTTQATGTGTWWTLKTFNEERATTAGYGTSSTGGNQAHNTVQPSLVTNYIIKAFQSAGTVANVSTTKTTSDTDTYSCNYINSMDKYSTDEVKTNKVWINNKPIYRKVFEGQLGTAITHNIINANFINIYGFYIGSSGNVFPLPSIRPNYPQYSCGIYVNNTQISFDVGGSLSNLNCYIVLEYTKTTD